MDNWTENFDALIWANGSGQHGSSFFSRSHHLLKEKDPEKWFIWDCYSVVCFLAVMVLSVKISYRELSSIIEICKESIDSKCSTLFLKNTTLHNILWLLCPWQYTYEFFKPTCLIGSDISLLCNTLQLHIEVSPPLQTLISCVVISYCLLSQWSLIKHVFTIISKVCLMTCLDW